MTCCASLAVGRDAQGPPPPPGEIELESESLGEGLFRTSLSIPALRCAACISLVERTLIGLDGVESARVNLSSRKAVVTWKAGGVAPSNFFPALQRIGYSAHLSGEEGRRDEETSKLLKALAVAGFGAMNIMLLSVSVWSGAEADVRHAFHLISAALALPVLLYSGRVFFSSAWAALRSGHTNMDVPISVGITLAFGLSALDVYRGEIHAYFDAATSLIFFLLIGRTLDRVMRQRAHDAVTALARLAPGGAHVMQSDGSTEYLAVGEVEPGDRLVVDVGQRFPVDGIVAKGVSNLDLSLITGESRWKPTKPGEEVQAGVLNLSSKLVVTAIARAEDSFLAEMVRLMEAAANEGPVYRALADRVARLYSPVIHGVALASFLGWLWVTKDWHLSLTVAIAVLIITCPCALGLAVPIVQVVAARRLYRRGIVVKNGAALERLAEADTVIFDKTGTLTFGQLSLEHPSGVSEHLMAMAASLARHSRHPVALSITSAAAAVETAAFDHVEEVVGYGIQAGREDTVYRLGRPGWAGAKQALPAVSSASSTSFSEDGRVLAHFSFTDRIRPGAERLIASLTAQGKRVEMLSGDSSTTVAALAQQVGIVNYWSELDPAGKAEHVRSARTEGRKVLMVGDGLNDAPAMAAAYVSIAPASAMDVGRRQADLVFLGEDLKAIKEAIDVALRSRTLIRQNFALAIGYNVIFIPVAVAGMVTPLLAALAMSLSSIVVVLNALRLDGTWRSMNSEEGCTVAAQREAMA